MVISVWDSGRGGPGGGGAGGFGQLRVGECSPPPLPDGRMLKGDFLGEVALDGHKLLSSGGQTVTMSLMPRQGLSAAKMALVKGKLTMKILHAQPRAVSVTGRGGAGGLGPEPEPEPEREPELEPGPEPELRLAGASVLTLDTHHTRWTRSYKRANRRSSTTTLLLSGSNDSRSSSVTLLRAPALAAAAGSAGWLVWKCCVTITTTSRGLTVWARCVPLVLSVAGGQSTVRRCYPCQRLRARVASLPFAGVCRPLA